MTIVQLRFGVRAEPDPERARRLGFWLDRTVRPWFDDRLLGLEEEAVLEWRTIAIAAQRSSRPAPPADLLIAAIAIVNRCGVATRDVAPFVAAGVPTFNPWTDERFDGT